jgi:hypothetical protein
MTDEPDPDEIIKEINKQKAAWITYGHQSQRDSLDSLDNAAKYLIGLVSIVYTLYTSILTYFGINGQISFSILYFIPLAIIFISLIVTLFVFSPGKRQVDFYDYTSIMGATIKRAKEKRLYLSIGIIIFILGVISIPCVVGYGIFTTQHQVQLIVSDDKIQDLKTIPIEFEINSSRTMPLTLLKMDDKSYTIQLGNGDIIQLNKSWIKVLIIKQ